MREKVIDHVEENHGFLQVIFIRQAETEGLGPGVYQARGAVVDSPMCIVLGDIIFDDSYAEFVNAHDRLDGLDGSLGVKQVDEPFNCGIVTM